MENKVVKTRNAEIRIDQQGICHHIYNEGAALTLEDTLNEIRIISEMTGHKRVSILVDLNHVKSIPRESRMYYASEEAGRIFKAAALLVGSQSSRIIGNFFIGLNKPAMPVKLFTFKEVALKWLADMDIN